MTNRRQKIINRELSWLSFNDRVLQEAQDIKNVPLIERIHFLGIFSNNLDEFFKVRVATIKRMIDIQEGRQRVEGEKPRKLMNKIQKKVLKLQNKFETAFHNILGELEQHDIFIINEKELNPSQEIFVRKYFKDKVMPVISPIMLQNVESFPYLKDKSVYFAIKLMSSGREVEDQYALIELPTETLPRFIELPTESERVFIILMEDIIRFALDDIFAIFKFDTCEAWTIKLTRDAELDMDNDVSQSFLEQISRSVSGRKTGQPVRFVFDNSIAKDLLDFIIQKLDLIEVSNLIPGGRYHNFKDFMNFPGIGSPNLVYEKVPPVWHKMVEYHKSIMAVMRERDFMLHVPYQDFNIFISLLQEAAIDPKVTEISLTIYRVAKNSKVINALMNACQNGKRVNVVIELQARFDEESNIYWSRKLEEVGANIFFGIPRLKVHAKLLCITRKEGRKTENFSCISTGNFHEGNAKVYSDLILFTADTRITNEVKKVFDFFANTHKNQFYRHLIASPLYMRKKLYKLIENEIKFAKEGKKAKIIIKLNTLVDKEIIYKLYQANNAGVEIILILRGSCSLIPGIPGMSENIKAISIVDKFLEHSRILIFHNKGDELYFISSADWMGRNLDRRIEIACPIYDKEIQQEIRDMIEIQLSDNVKARIINEEQDNQYVASNEQEPLRSQFILHDYYKKKLFTQ
ncbi:MAG: polyphosphate kinase 1 [Bacteroidales bacterium]|nr:polyphosphate kinase 1 [Bacteroidales bacterium]